MYIHRNYYTICVMSFCNHCKNQISSSALYLKFFVQFSSCRTQKKRTFKITKSQKIIFLYESIYSMAIEKFLHLWLLGWLLQEYNPEWAVRFRYGNFTLKLACVKKSLASRGPTALGTQAFSSLGLIFGGEEISIPEPRPILEILCFCLLFLTCTILFDLNFDCIWLQYWFDILFFRNSVILDELNDTLFLQNNLLIFLFSFSFRWWHFCKRLATTGHHSTTTSQR